MGFAGVLPALAVPFAAAFSRRIGRVGAVLAATASIAVVALLTANIFGEDDYTDDGRSRWETRTGGAARTLLILEAIVGALVAAGFMLIAFRRQSVDRIPPWLTALAAAQAIGAWIVLVAYNAN